MKSNLRRQRKIRKLKHHGKAFTLVETLIVLMMACFVVFIINFTLKETTNNFKERLFMEHIQKLLDETQLLAIITRQKQQIKYENNSYYIKTMNFGEVTLKIPETIKHVDTPKLLTYNELGETKPQKLKFSWEDRSDCLQYQLFYGHYRRRVTKK